jgi:hypothetical protein
VATPILLPAAPPPCDKIVTAYSTNPRLRARQPRAHEEYLEEILDEKMTVRMLAKDAAPVAFIVPDSFNAVDLYFGAIEANPEHAKPEDCEEVVTLGSPIVDGSCRGTLKVGDQINVVVPWRYASWVELAPDRLRVPITARFYSIAS